MTKSTFYRYRGLQMLTFSIICFTFATIALMLVASQLSAHASELKPIVISSDMNDPQEVARVEQERTVLLEISAERGWR